MKQLLVVGPSHRRQLHDGSHAHAYLYRVGLKRALTAQKLQPYRNCGLRQCTGGAGRAFNACSVTPVKGWLS